jgi:RNA polymerase sigma factor (TIGR02999 family)
LEPSGASGIDAATLPTDNAGWFEIAQQNWRGHCPIISAETIALGLVGPVTQPTPGRLATAGLVADYDYRTPRKRHRLGVSPANENVTILLQRMRDGDRSAFDLLFSAVYNELRALAGHVLQTPGHTLQPTALVHEAFVRLAQHDGGWNDRRHFFNVAAMAMRRLLIDHARRQKAQKRDGERQRLTTVEALDSSSAELDLVDFEDALSALEAHDARQARVVELRFIIGLTIEETAEALGISPRSVNVDWQLARAWLRRALGKVSSS